MAKIGLLVLLEAKPEKVDEVEKFLKDALPLVRREMETEAWFAMRLSPNTFGIFDAFNSESGRSAHLNGRVAKMLMEKAQEYFVQPPIIHKVDLLGVHMPKS